MKHGSLFSGIGGFDLAAQWMGWENAFHCEINPFGKAILKYYWPNSISYDDITKTDFTIWKGKLDILSGGFPCQPYSMAGKRLGKEDDRHLWPEMLRAIREIKPTWIVGENVYGLVNWNEGLVFNEVQVDLEAEGYEVQPVLLPAASVNAPHKRERVWFIAYSNHNRKSRTTRENESKSQKEWLQERNEVQQPYKPNNLRRYVTNTCCERCNYGSDNWQKRHLQNDQRLTTKSKSKRNRRKCRVSEVSEIAATFTNTKSQQGKRLQLEQRENSEQIKEQFRRGDSKNSGGRWEEWPTQPPICSGDDGLSSKLDGITFSKWRQESIKGYGNAIVPQVAYNIFKAVAAFNCG